MLTLLEIIKRTTDFLAGKGVESPRLNAEILIGHALGLKRMQLYLQFERPLTEPELEKIRPLVRRRGLREPLQYIVGETEFAGLKLKVDRRALIPRPETELLVETVVAAMRATPPKRILDLGTGTGAIALGLAKAWADARVTATDISAEALDLARDNAAATELDPRISFIASNWFDALSPCEPFDLIVANPPYLSAEETAAAAPEVRQFEPACALTAGDNGLGDLNTIFAGAPRLLNSGGLLAVETGIAHHGRLLDLAASAGLLRAESKKDLTGRDRFVLAWKP